MGIGTERPDPEKLIHLPWRGYYGKVTMEVSEDIVMARMAPPNQDWIKSPLYSMIYEQHKARNLKLGTALEQHQDFR